MGVQANIGDVDIRGHSRGEVDGRVGQNVDK